jgi:hypothetical protein
MSVLKRVEEAYLDVLRFIIIVVASVLLLGSIVFAVLAVGDSGSGKTGGSGATLTVNVDDVTNGVVDSRVSKKSSNEGESLNVDTKRESIDPNQALFERAANAIVGFVNKNGLGVESIEKEPVIQLCKNKASLYEDAEVAKEFATGLAVTMEKALADPKILKLIEPVALAPATVPEPVESVEGSEPAQQSQPQARSFKESPIGIANATMKTYIDLFDKQLADRERAIPEKDAAEIARKAEATQQLYIAAGAFGSFLLLVFISIVVKIERNLRNLSVPTKM